MQALITRPQPDAERFAEACSVAGLKPLLAPLMSVAFRSDWETPKTAGALAFTSANGVRAFAKASRVRNLPTFCVGEATADAAGAADFAAVHTAAGDVDSLAALIAENAGAITGQVVHIAGDRLAGDLIGALADRGVDAARIVAYETQETTTLPDVARTALGGGRALAVTLFSPRTAQLFLRLVAEANMTEALTRCRAVCLSEAVADAASGATWRVIDTAPARNAAAMIDMMKSGA